LPPEHLEDPDELPHAAKRYAGLETVCRRVGRGVNEGVAVGSEQI